MMYRTALPLALVLIVSSVPANAQPVSTLTYDASDGSLTIDPLGNTLYTYSVKTLGVFGGDDGFLEANHILLPDAPGGLTSPANTSTDDELSQSDFDGWINLDPFSLGNVLPTGLNETEFNNLLDSSIQNTFYVDALGTNNAPETFKAFDIVYNVPEPGSIVVLTIGAALLAQRRRRQ